MWVKEQNDRENANKHCSYTIGLDPEYSGVIQPNELSSQVALHACNPAFHTDP